MRIFLTGATGFVGRNLLLHLLRDENVEHITASVRNGGKLVAQLAGEGIYGVPSKLSIVTGHAKAWGVQESALAPDFCVHLAGTLFARERGEYFAANVEGTGHLWEELPGPTKILVVSSQSAVGPGLPGGGPVQEGEDPAPLSYYGESKLAMEKLLLELNAGQERLLILRPPMVLGPRDSATLPLFRMVCGWPWFKPGSRTKQLSWIAVDDLITAMQTALSPLGRELWQDRDPRFFVASAKTITDRELLCAAGAALGKSAPIVPLPDMTLRLLAGISALVPALGRSVPSLMPDRARELLATNWTVASDRFREATSWTDQENLPATLLATAEFFRREGLLPPAFCNGQQGQDRQQSQCRG